MMVIGTGLQDNLRHNVPHIIGQNPLNFLLDGKFTIQDLFSEPVGKVFKSQSHLS